jgi:hypothetical protein
MARPEIGKRCQDPNLSAIHLDPPRHAAGDLQHLPALSRKTVHYEQEKGFLKLCEYIMRAPGRLRPTGTARHFTSTVVPVNSQQVDKLRVVVRGSFSFRTRSNGRFRLPWRLVSSPEGPLQPGRLHWSLGPGLPEPNQDRVPASQHRRQFAGYRVVNCTWRLAS